MKTKSKAAGYPHIIISRLEHLRSRLKTLEDEGRLRFRSENLLELIQKSGV